MAIDCLVNHTVIVFVWDKPPHINQLFGQLLPEQMSCAQGPIQSLEQLHVHDLLAFFHHDIVFIHLLVDLQQHVDRFTCEPHMHQLMSACMNAPGTSRTVMSWFSKASITAVRNTASVLTVGAVDSSLAMYALCFRPSAHPRPLIFPQRLCLRNMRYANASFHCSGVKHFLCTGIITSRSYSCHISFLTAFTLAIS